MPTMRLPSLIKASRSRQDQPELQLRTDIPIATITPSSPVSSLDDRHEQDDQPTTPTPLALAVEQARLGDQLPRSRSSPTLPLSRQPTLSDAGAGPATPPLDDLPDGHHLRSSMRHNAGSHGNLRHAHFQSLPYASDPNLLTVDSARQSRPSSRAHSVVDVSPERSKSPTPSSAAPPQDFADLTVLYSVVAERRNSFDALLWQVPATSLTGHAFLFSIALAPDTSKFSRVSSMGLSILITCLTLHLFTRQLQAEDADHMWLTEFEERHSIDFLDRAHGARWRSFRHRKPPGAGWLGWLALHRSYPLWRNGFSAMAAVALSVIIVTFVDENLLLGYNCQPFSSD